jgi:hypothetical protein
MNISTMQVLSSAWAESKDAVHAQGLV